MIMPEHSTSTSTCRPAAAAVAELDVIMHDVSEEALQRGLKSISSSLAKFVRKGLMSQASEVACLIA